MNAMLHPICPALRIRELNEEAVRSQGKYVVYWMNAARRVRWNYALDRAVQFASELKRPLIVLEALRLDYPWESDRIHQFVLQGMADNRNALENTAVHYFPYVEPKPGDGKGLLQALCEDACVVVTDDFPGLFLPKMLGAAADQVQVRMEAIDSNGAVPVRAPGRVFQRAFDFRRYLQKELKAHLTSAPLRDSVTSAQLPRLRGLPSSVTKRWPPASEATLQAKPAVLRALGIDHDVSVTSLQGGSVEARRSLNRFARPPQGLVTYGNGRNHPDENTTSGLSPYLHFGHISTHEILFAVASLEGWTTTRIQPIRSGARLGWWGMSETCEGFLDQLITWRELGLNFATYRDDIQKYSSLPDWALKTLAEHEADARPHLYSLEEFDAAETHDPLWNAAQTELKRSGRLHNYMRML